MARSLGTGGRRPLILISALLLAVRSIIHLESGTYLVSLLPSNAAHGWRGTASWLSNLRGFENPPAPGAQIDYNQDTGTPLTSTLYIACLLYTSDAADE